MQTPDLIGALIRERRERLAREAGACAVAPCRPCVDGRATAPAGHPRSGLHRGIRPRSPASRRDLAGDSKANASALRNELDRGRKLRTSAENGPRATSCRAATHSRNASSEFAALENAGAASVARREAERRSERAISHWPAARRPSSLSRLLRTAERHVRSPQTFRGCPRRLRGPAQRRRPEAVPFAYVLPGSMLRSSKGLAQSLPTAFARADLRSHGPRHGSRLCRRSARSASPGRSAVTTGW